MALLADADHINQNWFVDFSQTSPGWWRIGLAIAMLVVAVAVAGRRIAWLVRLIRSGKADKTRLTASTSGSRTSSSRCSVSANC